MTKRTHCIIAESNPRKKRNKYYLSVERKPFMKKEIVAIKKKCAQ